jgi:hypothetical protein
MGRESLRRPRRQCAVIVEAAGIPVEGRRLARKRRRVEVESAVAVDVGVISSNRPRPSFSKRKFAISSFITRRSASPSSSWSVAKTPIPRPTAAAIPLSTLTSKNVPSPALK